MGARLLQINYTLNVPLADFRRKFGPAAHEIASVPGLCWKVWIADEERSEGGGIYLFDDQASLDAYVNGPIVAGIRSHPAFADVRIKTFNVLADETTVTRGPIRAAAAVLPATAGK